MCARPLLSLLATALTVSSLAACSGGPGPADELKSLLDMLGNPTISSSRLGAQVYRLLDEGSRAEVDARATALGKQLGVEVEPSDILQVRGFVTGARVSRIEVVPQDDEHAQLLVSFAPLEFVAGPTGQTATPDPASAGSVQAPSAAEALRAAEPPASAVPPPTTPAPSAAPAQSRISVVKENGRWRMALRDLAQLVAAVPLDAPRSAGAPR
jgi:hypothetical protein